MHRRLLTAMFAGTCAATGAVAPADANAAGAPAHHAGAQAPIPYDELVHHVGERIVVHTIFKSTRVGVLIKFSKVELTLDIPTSSGPAELTMPKATVLRVLPAGKPSGTGHDAPAGAVRKN